VPPRSRRWCWVRPEDAGIGGAPAVRASFASVAERLTPAISPSSLAVISVPQPRSASSLGASAETSVASSLLVPVSSRMRRSSSRVVRTRALCSARVSWLLRRVCQWAVLSARGGDLVLGPEVVQVPAQVRCSARCAAQRSARRDRRAAGRRALVRPAARSGASPGPREAPRVRSRRHRSHRSERETPADERNSRCLERRERDSNLRTSRPVSGLQDGGG